MQNFNEASKRLHYVRAKGHTPSGRELSIYAHGRSILLLAEIVLLPFLQPYLLVVPRARHKRSNNTKINGGLEDNGGSSIGNILEEEKKKRVSETRSRPATSSFIPCHDRPHTSIELNEAVTSALLSKISYSLVEPQSRARNNGEIGDEFKSQTNHNLQDIIKAITDDIEYKDAFMRVQNKQLQSQVLSQSSEAQGMENQLMQIDRRIQRLEKMLGEEGEESSEDED